MIEATLTVTSSGTSGMAEVERMGADAAADPLGGVERQFGVEMVEQQREGAAAVARGDVAGADQALQQPGDVAQSGVAGDPAMAFVDRLEIVDLDREQGGGRAVARGLAQHPLELADELARIEQGGQRIAAAVLLELAEPRTRLGERGAEQRILVGQPAAAPRALRARASALPPPSRYWPFAVPWPPL